MKAAGLLVLILALSGCQSTTSGVSQETVSWTAAYKVPFDAIVTCLATNTAQPLTPAPQVSRQDGVAHIVLGQTSLANSAAQEFTVRRVSEGETAVDWRRSQPVGTGSHYQTWSRYTSDRCAKSYSNFGPGAYGLTH